MTFQSRDPSVTRVVRLRASSKGVLQHTAEVTEVLMEFSEPLIEIASEVVNPFVRFIESPV